MKTRRLAGVVVIAALALSAVRIMTAAGQETDPTAPARNRMVQRHLVERGIKNPRVLEAFRTVPRHQFLPPETPAAGVR